MSPALADNVAAKAAEDIKTSSNALIEDVLKIYLQSEPPTDLVGNRIEAVSKVACSIRMQGEK
jgi:hypothetical protein